jgi:hypothetical protein
VFAFGDAGRGVHKTDSFHTKWICKVQLQLLTSYQVDLVRFMQTLTRDPSGDSGGWGSTLRFPDLPT